MIKMIEWFPFNVLLNTPNFWLFLFRSKFGVTSGSQLKEWTPKLKSNTFRQSGKSSEMLDEH